MKITANGLGFQFFCRHEIFSQEYQYHPWLRQLLLIIEVEPGQLGYSALEVNALTTVSAGLSIRKCTKKKLLNQCHFITTDKIDINAYI